MLLRLCGLCLLVVAPLVFAPCASGQQADTTQLPEIAPREIEIRGERQIALPSLERQPLSGFTSPPTLPSVPADHRPYRGSYAPSIDGIPDQLPVPDAVSASMRPSAEPQRGYLEGGSGRYFSRFFEGRLGVPLSPQNRLSVHGAYTGTEADPNDDVAHARVRLSHTADPVRIDGRLHGAVQRYALYGASLTNSFDSQSPDREGSTAGGAVQVRRTSPQAPARLSAQYDNTQYTSDLRANTDGLDFSQQQLTLDGTATLPLPYRPRLAAEYRRSWLGTETQDETAYDLRAEGTVSISPIESISIRGGAAVLAFETPAQPTQSPSQSVDQLRVGPVVDAEWRVAEGTRLHLRNHPRLGDTALERLYETNPYAQHAPSLRPTLEPIRAEAGLTHTRGRVRMVVAGGYRYAPTYRYFSLDQQNDVQGIYRVGYDAARIFQGRGEVALLGVDGVQASLGLSVRDGSLSDLDQPIPNFAPVTADAQVTVSFADGDGFVQAHGEFQSSRDAGLDQTVRADPYFTMNLEGSYALGSDVDVVARVNHLSVEDPTQWANYPQPVAELSVGLRLRW
jgi:hypothetical protein